MNPVSGEYAIGSPLFREVEITLPDGKILTISAPGNDDRNRYVDRVRVNGKACTVNYLTREQLRQGGTIEFRMAAEPNTKRGVDKASRPYSFSEEYGAAAGSEQAPAASF